MYELCVVGAGMIGSAAAKYLSEKFGRKVILIGLEEPERSGYADHSIFGAHYDEGRITRNLDSNHLWGQLARKSIKRYRDIENKSGFKFYTENGYLVVADSDSSEIAENIECAQRLSIPVQVIPSSELIRKQFPYLSPLPQMAAIYEGRDAGTVNPRQLVKAQLEIFRQNHGKVLADTVIGIDKNHENLAWTVETAKFGDIEAKKVVLCPGAFLSHLKNMPHQLSLVDLRPRTAVAARIRVNDITLRQKLASSMPSVFFTSKNHYQSVPGSTKAGHNFYMLAPVQYADGHWYLKLGMDSTYGNYYFKNPEEITDWFQNSYSSERATREGEMLKKIAASFIPELDTSHTVLDTCAITVTPNEHPFIDMVLPDLYVACGGNGWAAKSSDELGRLVSILSCESEEESRENSMLDSFPKSLFRCHYVAENNTVALGVRKDQSKI